MPDFLKGKAKELWEKVYNDYIEQGLSEEEAAKRAWGAIKKAGLYEYEDKIEATDKIQEILVFPRGRFYIESKGDWIEFDDEFFNQIAEAFDSDTLNKPFIDKNHEYTESFGDVLGYEIKDDGMYFKIKLNERGVELIKNRIYTNISPAFGEVVDTNGKKWENVLTSISLTNMPALMRNLPALQEQIKLEISKRNNKMKLTQLTRILKLQDEASEEAITNAVQEILTEIDNLKTKLDETTTKLQEMIQQKEEVEKEKQEVEAELNKIKEANLQKEAKEVVELAIKRGQFHPSIAELKIKQYIKNKDDVLNELKLIPIQSETKLSRGIIETENGLSEEDIKIMKDRGLDISNEKDISFYKKSVYGN